MAAFRDVFEVDSKPIPFRVIVSVCMLLVDAKTDPRHLFPTIQAESARFNIGPLQRTITTFRLALLFLERQYQSRLLHARAEAGNVKRFADLAKEDDI